ncbi:MAG: serine--tRNA ligase [Omnitrophica bacterium RIFCSPLOWO2_01_FULL_45_10]|nr:MAG: serine--tRNA ligase [Omnitrophica bacterium RIFCSPLOWO2_01_FULL_45_10]
MLDIKFIRDNKDLVKESIKNRRLTIDIDELLRLDDERRKLLVEVEGLKNQRNKANDEITGLMKAKKNPKEIIDKMKVVSQKISDFDTKVDEIEQKLTKITYIIPNIPDKSVPIGGPEEKKIVKSWGKNPTFDFNPRTHIELAELLGIISFGTASKISGSNFILFLGLGARLERALINFMLDLHTKKHGYKEVFPPFLVNRRSMTGTGQLPKLEEDMYRLKDDDLFLIPTAEVPVTNIHANEILDEEKLPIYYTAYTACFRREAGSYGKDTRGMIRVHQFDKVELVKFVKPESSFNELEKLLADAEEVLQLLELPYRVVLLSTGDISFAAAKCYDIELYSAGTDAYLEVSSCSNFTDFQARRAGIRYRQKATKKISYVHTLNGSGVALARLVVAILENYQNKDGSVNIPKALTPYMDGLKVIMSSE